MLQLDDTNIDDIFNITDPLHRRALINSVNAIKDRGVKPPSNLWEFKVGMTSSNLSKYLSPSISVGALVIR